MRLRRLKRDGQTGAGRTVASSGRVRVISSPVRADMLCSHEFVGTRLSGTMAVRRRSVAHVPHLPAASVCPYLVVTFRRTVESDRKSTRLNPSHVASSYAVF